jgi:ABC-type uncharacterized transport system permease subunit
MAHNQIPYFKTWFIYTLCSLVVSFASGMVIGFVLGAILGIAGASLETIQVVCAIAGFVLGLAISYLIFRWVVDRFIVPAIASSATATHTG